MAWLEGAIAWKLQDIRETQREVGREIAEVLQHPERAWQLRSLGERLIKLDQERADVTGTDRKKAWGVVKENLERLIAVDERILRETTEPAVREIWQREIGAYKSLLGGLLVEGQPD